MFKIGEGKGCWKSLVCVFTLFYLYVLHMFLEFSQYPAPVNCFRVTARTVPKLNASFPCHKRQCGVIRGSVWICDSVWCPCLTFAYMRYHRLEQAEWPSRKYYNDLLTLFWQNNSGHGLLQVAALKSVSYPVVPRASASSTWSRQLRRPIHRASTSFSFFHFLLHFAFCCTGFVPS